MGINLPSPFRTAALIATKSTLPTQMGAVAVKGGRILNFACNERGRGTLGTWTRHAEFRLAMNTDLSGSSVYIFRQHKQNKMPRIAKPCPPCMEYLRELGVRKVIYTLNDPPWYHTERI